MLVLASETQCEGAMCLSLERSWQIKKVRGQWVIFIGWSY